MGLILSGRLECDNVELILSGRLELILSGDLELILLYPMIQSEQTFPPSTQLAVLAMPRHDRACFMYAVPQTSQTTSCSRRPRVRNSKRSAAYRIISSIQDYMSKRDEDLNKDY